MFRREGMCIIVNLFKLFLTILLYVDDVVFLAKIINDIYKQLKVLEEFNKNYELTINIDKTKNTIIKSNKIMYSPILYGDSTLEEVQSCKYLYNVNFNCHLN